MMVRHAAMLAFVLTVGTVAADSGWYAEAGLSSDTSSNMLMRPDGASGTVGSVYGGAGYGTPVLDLSYSVDGAVVEGYDGIQYQRHILGFLGRAVAGERLTVDIGLDAAAARYGDVTLLDGYNEVEASALMKSYIALNLLLRWRLQAARRSYIDLEAESYTQAETWVRLDRFFASGTTLRGQIDLGIRDYHNIEDTETTDLYGLRLRVAQSLGPGWGAWAEIHVRGVNAGMKDGGDTYDRVFHDDRYRYSSRGLVAGVKHLLTGRGVLEATAHYTGRRYGEEQAVAYTYLPPDGWDEDEWGVSLMFEYRGDHMPAFVHPSAGLYHIRVDASEPSLAFSSTGLSVRFDVY